MNHFYTKSSFFSIVLLLLSTALFAQGKGSISGKVFDEGKQALEYATVSVELKSNPGVPVDGAITGENGSFKIENLALKTYTVKVSFLGLETKTIADVTLTADKPNANLNQILLKESVNKLNSVEIVEEKSMVHNEIDKMVINVGKDLSTTGGTASDVLQNVPSVTTDVDGNISLRGSSNFRVFVNGKPQLATSNSLSTYLQSIPASSIENIEVITNPSAKYDAEGVGGIININLKKNRKEGLNGNLSLIGGYIPDLNASAALSYKGKWFNIYSNYSFLYSERNTYSNLRGNINFSDSTYSQKQVSYGTDYQRNHLPQLGVDFYLNDKNTISINGTYNYRSSNGHDRINRSYANSAGNYFLHSQNFGQETDVDNSVDVQANYTRLFTKKKQQLSFDFAQSYNHSQANRFTEEDYFLGTQRYTDLYEQLSNETDEKKYSYIWQTDYAQPLGKGNSLLELGYKGEFRYFFNTSDINGTIAQALKNAAYFIYEQNIEALYSTFSSSFGILDYKFGLRYEYSSFRYSLPEETVKGKKHSGFFPTIHLQTNLAKNASVYLNYTRRINRPNYRFINPNTSYNDSRNLRKGNPNLDPELTDAYELGYQKMFKMGSFNANLFVRNTENAIGWIRTIDENGIATLSHENLNTELNYGLELSSQLRTKKWLNLNLNASLNGFKISDPRYVNNQSVSGVQYGAGIMAILKPSKNASIQLSYRYRGPSKYSQGKMKAFHFTDIAAKYSILKGKGSVSVRLSDPFALMKFRVHAYGDSFDQEFTRQRTQRKIYLGFSYNFGAKPNSSRKRNNSYEDGGMDIF